MDFQQLFKFNSFHDERGRFAAGDGADSGGKAPQPELTKERSLHAVAEDLFNDSFWQEHFHPGSDTGKGAEVGHLSALLVYAESNKDTFDNINTKEKAIGHIEGALKALDWYNTDKSQQYKDELKTILARLKALPADKTKRRLFPSGPESTLYRDTEEQG